MIIVRTPYRLTLGGGSTDLPAYYEKFGGFIFAVTINLYLYVGLNRPPFDDRIRLKYFEIEEVDDVEELSHKLVKYALKRLGIDKKIDMFSLADIPDKTGLGSSSTFLVGLLNALHTLKGDNFSRRDLAEEAFHIATQDAKCPEGKQDFYLASFGNFCILEIDKDGKVDVANAKISRRTQEEFERKTLLFYTGVRRSNAEILTEQQVNVRENQQYAIELKHQVKKIGREILDIFEAGNGLDDFGRLMDEHWQVKKGMSNKMSNPIFDEIYTKVRKNGVLGGKIAGAGGGGFFMVYCQDGYQEAVRKVFAEYNYREIPFQVDSTGTQVLLHRSRLV